MTILIDTNVVIDVLSDRAPFADDSAKVVKLCENGAIVGFVTATTITDIYYVLGKTLIDKSRLYAIMEEFLSIVKIGGVTHREIMGALAKRARDFEDALQAECAASLRADYVVTRNVKDFARSQAKAITPTEFLALIADNV
jgi:predicted nucleic acid-binding protein